MPWNPPPRGVEGRSTSRRITYVIADILGKAAMIFTGKMFFVVV